MPVLDAVIDGLGLRTPAVYDIGFFAASRADRAITFHHEQDARRRHDPQDHGKDGAIGRPAGEHDAGPDDWDGASGANGASEPSEANEVRETPADEAGRVRYVRDHGLRAIGVVGLFDQDAATELGTRLLSFLRDAYDPCWPLAYASAPLPPPIAGSGGSLSWSELAGRLASEPASAARELARCLLPPAREQPHQPDRPQPTLRWNEQRPGARWSRQALAPYGIDLELLRTVVQGRVGGRELLPVSYISMPALARTLFRSIEAALADARTDEFHWSNGLSTIQPTDPEVLLAVRACPALGVRRCGNPRASPGAADGPRARHPCRCVGPEMMA